MLDAAAIGGWKPVALPTAMEAAAVALSRKYPEAAAEGGEGGAPPGRHVILLDMGAASTSVGLINVDAEAGQQLVSETGDALLGCADFDAAVWAHFAAHCKAVHRIEVTRGSRGGQRLLDACKKARELLSTLPQVRVRVRARARVRARVRFRVRVSLSTLPQVFSRSTLTLTLILILIQPQPYPYPSP